MSQKNLEIQFGSHKKKFISEYFYKELSVLLTNFKVKVLSKIAFIIRYSIKYAIKKILQMKIFTEKFKKKLSYF